MENVTTIRGSTNRKRARSATTGAASGHETTPPVDTLWRAPRFSTGSPRAMEDASATSETMVDASEAFVNAGFDADALIAALEAATGMPLPAIAAVALL